MKTGIVNMQNNSLTMYKDNPDSTSQKPVKITSTTYKVGSLAETKNFVYYIQEYNDHMMGSLPKGYIYRIDKKLRRLNACLADMYMRSRLQMRNSISPINEHFTT